MCLLKGALPVSVPGTIHLNCRTAECCALSPQVIGSSGLAVWKRVWVELRFDVSTDEDSDAGAFPPALAYVACVCA